MRRPVLAAILLLAFLLPRPQYGVAARITESQDPAGVLRRLSRAVFAGSGQNSIQAVATDLSGNVYVTGATSSTDFPVKHPTQPNFGDSRIMRTADLGTTWTRVGSPPHDVNVVVPDPVAPLVLFAGGDSGIYKSTDGGQTWRLVYQFPSIGFQFSGALVIDPGNHLRLAAITPFTGILIRSLDGGETWNIGAPSCQISSCFGHLFADPTGSGVLLVSDLSLNISHDWGATLQPLLPPSRGGAATVAFDPSHPGWIYAAGSAGVMGSLSFSTDFGATWTAKASPPTIFSGILRLAVDPDQPNTLVAATPDGLYKSSDGAASWVRQQGPGAPAFSVGGFQPFAILSHHCSPQGGLFAQGGFQQVAFSPDDGVSWMTPQLTKVTSVTAGLGCSVYVTRQVTSDAFVAKLAPDGSTLWATFMGGSDQDAPVALVVDTQGNAYVTGNTSSPDFPVTAPRIGVAGQGSVFVTKFSSDGQLAYSVLVGGESRNTASAIAVDASQNAYIVGATNSVSFPVTPGTLVTSLQPGSNAGFLLKLSSRADLVYATFTGEAYNFPRAILVEAGGGVIIAGAGQVPGLPSAPGFGSDFVMKLDPAASHVASATYIQGTSQGRGPTALATDAQGNLFVLGATYRPTFQVTPGAYNSPPPSSFCTGARPSPISGDVYVTKLRAADWQPIYRAALGGQCGSQPGAMAIDHAGAVVFAVATGAGFPLHNPLLGGPTCSVTSSVVAKLSPDGATLEFATYLDDCGVPGIALANDGSLYAGVTHGPFNSSSGVLHLPLADSRTVSLDRISNAFSGDARAVVKGGLYSLAGLGFPAPAIDLGLNPSQDLPAQLGGIQVLFDGIFAAILQTSPGQTSPGRVIVVPPDNVFVPPARSGPHPPHRMTMPNFTSVQVIYNGVASNAVWMPVSASLPGLLTRNFPDLQTTPDVADANARNDDGTVNDADHPAAAGSTVTLFGTGLGATSSPVAPGSIAHSANIVPVSPLYDFWNADPEAIGSVPGYVSALFQIRIKIPNSTTNLGGTPLANGVQRVALGLYLNSHANASTSFPLASNQVAVYLK